MNAAKFPVSLVLLIFGLSSCGRVIVQHRPVELKTTVLDHNQKPLTDAQISWMGHQMVSVPYSARTDESGVATLIVDTDINVESTDCWIQLYDGTEPSSGPIATDKFDFARSPEKLSYEITVVFGTGSVFDVDGNLIRRRVGND